MSRIIIITQLSTNTAGLVSNLLTVLQNLEDSTIMLKLAKDILLMKEIRYNHRHTEETPVEKISFAETKNVGNLEEMLNLL